ncbi:MAG: hypothetical protein AAB473_05465 [Patescibacteria group bacterium]
MTITEQFMLDQLERADGILTKCLANPTTRWYSTLIDDAFPNVERIWVRMDNGYLAVIHRILPVPKGAEPLYYWHRRPTGFLVMDGSYRTGIGNGPPGESPPPIVRETICYPGERRTMIQPNDWHWVKPVRHSVISVNVVGPAHPGIPERATRHSLFALPPDRLARLVQDSRLLYGVFG